MLRGSYHLYQGIGGFIGNLAMGVVFVYLYRRWGRVGPLVVAHSLLDIGAFVGYALLMRQGRVAPDGVKERGRGARRCRTPLVPHGPVVSGQELALDDGDRPARQQGALAAQFRADEAGAA